MFKLCFTVNMRTVDISMVLKWVTGGRLPASRTRPYLRIIMSINIRYGSYQSIRSYSSKNSRIFFSSLGVAILSFQHDRP